MSKSTRSKRSSAEGRLGDPSGPAPGGRDPAPWPTIFAVLGLAAVAIGAYARLRGLGRWPVSFDEFLMGKSVRNILGTGLPRLADGGFYARGLLVQYALAGARLSGLPEELALRIVPALSNLAAIPAVYLLARKISGRGAAWAAAAFCALSATEIEFARFARMYAPLQAVFAWFCLFLHDLVVERNERRRIPLYLLALLAIFVHESAVFLAALLFLPAWFDSREARPRALAAPLALLAAAVYVNAVDFRGIAGPAGAASAGTGVLARALGKVHIPEILASQALSGWGSGLAVVLLGALCAIAIYRTARTVDLAAPARILLASCVLLAFCNLFLPVALLLSLAWLSGWVRRQEIRFGQLRWPSGALLACAIFWILFLLLRPGDSSGPALKGMLATIASATLSWPEIGSAFLHPWARTLPFHSAMVAGLLVLAAVHLARARFSSIDGARLLGVVAIATAALVGVVRTPYYSTRYSFFLYPLVLVAAPSVLRGVAARLFRSRGAVAAAFAVLSVSFLAFSEDVRVDRLFRAFSLETNFRLRDTWPEANHFIPRVDYRAPADFVDASRRDGDVVISVALPLDFYLDRPLDIFYLPREDPEFRNHARTKSGRERWTGARVLADEGSLFRFVESSASPVWLVFGSESYPYKKSVSRAVAERFGPARKFRSRDGRLDVYRVEPGSSVAVPHSNALAGARKDSR